MVGIVVSANQTGIGLYAKSSSPTISRNAPSRWCEDGETVGVKISDTDSGSGGIFNGMTGAQLKQLREDLGEAIGRPLTVKDFAKLCGLPPESGGGTILEWENGYGPIGPVAALLSLLSVASDRYPIDEEIISESDSDFYRAMMRAGIVRRLG